MHYASWTAPLPHPLWTYTQLAADSIAADKMHHLIIPHHLHVQTPPSEEEDPLDALDRVKEILADGDHPFPVDRRTLKDVVSNKMGQDVERIKFMSSGERSVVLWLVAMELTRTPGTFHKVCTSVEQMI
jgi:hypothetical protein